MNVHTHLAPIAHAIFGFSFAATGVHKLAGALPVMGWSSSALAAVEIATGLVLMLHVLQTGDTSRRL